MNGQKYLRGQVWWLGPKKDIDGNLQTKNRPHLIVGNNIGNRNSPVLIVIPFTTEIKKEMPTHVKLDINGISNTLLCEQIKTVNNIELTNYIFTLDEESMDKVEDAILISLGMKDVPNKFSNVIYNEEVEENETKENIVWNDDTIQIDTTKKGHKWTDEMKRKYIEDYEKNPYLTKIKYGTYNNYKAYYKRFCKYFEDKEIGEGAKENEEGIANL